MIVANHQDLSSPLTGQQCSLPLLPLSAQHRLRVMIHMSLSDVLTHRYWAVGQRSGKGWEILALLMLN